MVIDQPIEHLIGMPGMMPISEMFIKKVIAIMHVEHRIMPAGVVVVTRRQIDVHRSVVVQIPGLNIETLNASSVPMSRMNGIERFVF